jgi:hypothetical protein
MTYSKQLHSYAHDLVVSYATYDKLDDFYSLIVTDVPDFAQQDFARLILASNDDIANEATGCDNPHFDKKMLPALLALLKDSTEPDNKIEFIEAYRDGVTAYCQNIMQELIDEALCDYNSDLDLPHDKNPTGFRQDVGQPSHSWW